MDPPSPVDRIVPLVLYLAGATNILGVLLFSLGFTNADMFAVWPELFSVYGLIVIMLWGAAYLAVARVWEWVPALLAVFAVEKAVYFVTWVIWLSTTTGGELDALAARSPMAAAFFALYGVADLIFGLLFAWAAWVAWQRHRIRDATMQTIASSRAESSAG